MNKKVLSLVLALVIVLGSFGTVLAADPLSTQDQKIQWLIDNEVVAGRKVNADGSADLALDEFLTRAEVTKLIVYTLKLQNLADALKGVMQPFPDVALDHWANGYISVATTQRADVANGRRIVIGYPDGKFYPNNNVTYAELATMLVRIVKKDLTDAMEKNAIWATSYMRWAEEEGILKGLTIADSNKPVPRRDAFEMIYNAMFLLDKANYNAPKFGDVMGIVSKAQAGIIQLNQDSKMEYKITFNSRVTDGTTWGSIAENSNLPGSLVRLIANEQGEILYIIELGSPRDGALETSRWFDVADKTAETNDFGTRDAVAGDAYFFDEYFKKIYVNGAEATIDSDTRFFVADLNNNALREVENLADVFRLYIRDYKDLNKVYMGYDEYQGRREAKVIVFGEVDKYMGGTATRRVTNYYATNRNIAAEDTKGNVQTYDFVPFFPTAKRVDLKDVVKIYLDGDKYTSANKAFEVIIDYSEDPVYEITAIGDRYIELKDEYGYARRFYMKDADVFLEGQAKKGAHVQIELANNNADVIVVSVVDKALDGALPTGVRRGMEDGYIVRYEELADGRMTVTIAGDRLNKTAPFEYRNLKTYEVATDWRAAVKALGRDVRVVYDIGDKFGTTPYIYNVELWSDNGIQPGTGNLPRLFPVDLTGVAEKGNLATGEYNKDAITLRTNEWNILPRYAEATVRAAVAPAGKVFAGFKVTGSAVKLTENLANREATFQMPQTGDVRIEAVYNDVVVTDARVENTGECDIQIVAVNGVELEAPLPVQAGEIVRKYTDPETGDELNFKTGDKVVVQLAGGACESGDCELTHFNVAKTCGAGNAVPTAPVLVGNVTTDACGRPDGDQECLDCAAVIELACYTEVEAVGRRENATTSMELTLTKLANGGTQVRVTVPSTYFTIEDAKVENGRLSGKIVLTEAGKEVNAEVVKNIIRNVADSNLVSEEVFRDGVNFWVELTTCEDDCEGKVLLNLIYDLDCAPCSTIIN